MLFRSINVRLLSASKNGKTDEARRLLDKGAFPNVKEANGMATPLHHATKTGRLDIVHMLLERGAHANVRTTDGWTPLHYAAEGGHVEMVRLLLEKGGADMNAKTCYGRTPLHAAAVHCHAKVVAVLLEKGADVSAQNFNGSTPLHQASILGHTDVAGLLMDNGADLSIKNKDGKTPLELAKDDQTELSLSTHEDRRDFRILQEKEQVREQVAAVFEEKEQAMYRNIVQEITHQQNEKHEAIHQRLQDLLEQQKKDMAALQEAICKMEVSSSSSSSSSSSEEVDALKKENASLRETLAELRQQLKREEKDLKSIRDKFNTCVPSTPAVQNKTVRTV